MDLDLYLTPYLKINSNWAINLNVRAKMIKLLDKRHNLGLGNNFLYIVPKSQVMKEKIDHLDFIKVKTFLCFTKYYQESEKTVHIMETNICKSYIDKRLSPAYIYYS